MGLFIRLTANKSLFISNFCSSGSINQCRLHRTTSLFADLWTSSRCCRVMNRFATTANKFPTSKSSITGPDVNHNRSHNISDSIGIFDKFLSARRTEAKRSVIIQVQSPNSYSDLYSYCLEFGEINNVYHYTGNKTSHFFLVEFKNVEGRKAVLEAATYINHQETIPMHSNMLWFRNNLTKSKKIISKNVPAITIASNQRTDANNLDRLLLNRGVSEQMEILYNICKIDEISIRLRFITALQMEDSFSSLFPNISVLPFGSSVNSFGKRGCDLDLVMALDGDKHEKIHSRLVYQTKSSLANERAQTKRSMEIIADIMQVFMPGIKHIRKILDAKVPIIKYDHIFTGIECDLSMANLTAVYMSELLYILAECDHRVRPLVFTVRHWASSVGITNISPGGWITNFSITLLVIFFLQQKKILPSINLLQKLARPSDARITDTCIDCTFLRDPTMIPKAPAKSANESLETLLFDFYNYYANFDFASKAICLRAAAFIYKPDKSPLFICNPMEQLLNVSKNVSVVEVMRFINATRNAAMLMEEGFQGANSQGLPDIFVEKQPQKKQFIIGRNTASKRTVQISELFKLNGTEKLENNVVRRENTVQKIERVRRR